jgi:hypothetical protein
VPMTKLPNSNAIGTNLYDKCVSPNQYPLPQTATRPTSRVCARHLN